jgi:hypothetical protein
VTEGLGFNPKEKTLRILSKEFYKKVWGSMLRGGTKRELQCPIKSLLGYFF